MEFHDISGCALKDEDLIFDIKNGGNVCTVSEDTDRNFKLVPYDTSRRKGNEKSTNDKVMHDITRNVDKDEALVDDKCDDCDEFVVFQEDVRNNK